MSSPLAPNRHPSQQEYVDAATSRAIRAGRAGTAEDRQDEGRAERGGGDQTGCGTDGPGRAHRNLPLLDEGWTKRFGRVEPSPFRSMVPAPVPAGKTTGRLFGQCSATVHMRDFAKLASRTSQSRAGDDGLRGTPSLRRRRPSW